MEAGSFLCRRETESKQNSLLVLSCPSRRRLDRIRRENSLIAMYGRSSINSVAGGGDGGGSDGARDKGGRAQSPVSSSSGDGYDSSTSSTSSSLVGSGPRLSRDVRGSISSSNQNTGNGSSCTSSFDGQFFGPRSVANPSESYDHNILKNRASVLSQLSSIFGQRAISSRRNSLVQQRQVKKKFEIREYSKQSNYPTCV